MLVDVHFIIIEMAYEVESSQSITSSDFAQESPPECPRTWIGLEFSQLQYLEHNKQTVSKVNKLLSGVMGVGPCSTCS